MIIISDTSAVTSLVQIGRLEILPALYQKVIIPVEVAEELKRFHTLLPGFIEVLPVSDRVRLERLQTELDPGEAAAIALMLEGKGDLLLMDERCGRKIAVREGLAVIGVIGVLLEARQHGLIVSLSEAIRELEQIAGFRISPQLKRHILQKADEK
jgi:uncharacterized protein